MKPRRIVAVGKTADPAAFRRLCVETSIATRVHGITNPAAFRRLCVETGYEQAG